MEKPRLSFWQIWNMCFGFFGIQFGWTLQMNNMSAIYQYLGAEPDKIAGLWLAAPMTGLIIQPIVGYLSDRTWHPKLGRRRPYFMVGAILSSIMLLIMPNSPSVWIAAGSLWILDSSINISMEPFRAFVGDKLSEKQQSFGYAMQSMFIGGASFIAGFLPMLLNRYFGINNESVNNSIPDNIRWSFYIGAIAFFLSVLYTVLRADEYPPDEKELDKLRAQKISPTDIVKEIFQGIINMPSNMKRLALVQFLTWPGLFLMWFYYTPSVANYIFKATSTSDPNYTSGVEFANMTYSIENLVTFLFSFTLPFWVGFLGKRNTHIVCLFIGALGLFSIQYIHSPNMLFLTMGMVGIAWASILSMPYSLLAGTLPPQKMGFYMGVFNFFIVIPEILASLFFGWILKNWLDNNMMLGVVTGGVLMALAALACFFVKENVPQFQEEGSKISH